MVLYPKHSTQSLTASLNPSTVEVAIIYTDFAVLEWGLYALVVVVMGSGSLRARGKSLQCHYQSMEDAFSNRQRPFIEACMAGSHFPIQHFTFIRN